MADELIASLSARNEGSDAFVVFYRWAERDFEDLLKFREERYRPAGMLRLLRRERRRLQGLRRARRFAGFADRILRTSSEKKLGFREFHRAERSLYRFAMMRDLGSDANLAPRGRGEGGHAGRPPAGAGRRPGEIFDSPWEFGRFAMGAEKLILDGGKRRAGFFDSPGEFVSLARHFNRTEDEQPFLWLYDYIRNFLELCPKSYLENGVFGKFMRSVFGVFFFARAAGNKEYEEIAKLAGYFATTYLFDDILDDPEYDDLEKEQFTLNVDRILRAGKHGTREYSGDSLMACTEAALAAIQDLLDEDRGMMVAQSYLAIAGASAVGAWWNYETPLKDSELYAIAAVKAAHTRVIPAILGGCHVDAEFVSHCMRAGLIYQLTDDLRDITDDLEERNVTPFNYFRHGARRLGVHPIEVFLAAASRISMEHLPAIPGAEALWIMRLSHSLRVLRLKHGEGGLKKLFADLDFPAGQVTDELAMVGECFGEIIDIEAEAAKAFSDIGVRMRGGWSKDPVHGH